MNNKNFLIPKKDTIVLLPDGSKMPPEGAYVQMDTYWRRRLIDGSVSHGKPPRKTKAASTQD